MRYEDVRDNVQAFMSGAGGAGWRSVSDVLLPVSAAAKVETGDNGYQRYRGHRTEGQKLEGQVRRALNELAERGALVKRPGKRWSVYAPAAYVEARQAAESERQARRAADEAQAGKAADRVLSAFAAAGIEARYYGHEGPVPRFIVSLTPELLDRLVRNEM